jgi:hypothetical protein
MIKGRRILFIRKQFYTCTSIHKTKTKYCPYFHSYAAVVKYLENDLNIVLSYIYLLYYNQYR